MGWDVAAYWVCFFSGMAYATVSALLGTIFGFEHDGGDVAVPHDGHDFGGGHGGEGAGHGEADAGQGPGEVTISPLSPMTISVFSTVFGGTGLILTKMFKYNLFVTLPAAVLAAVVVSGAVFMFFFRVFNAVQASSEVQMGALVGVHGEVTVAIPAEGVGEIAYVTMGGRYTAIARSATGKPIERYAPVSITRVVGTMVYVEPVEKGAPEGATG